MLSVSPDVGSLLLRLGTGILLVIHGWSKLVASSRWEELGASFSSVFGVSFFPVAWGIFVAAVQVLGGVLIAVGFFTRLSALLAFFVMVVFSVAIYQQTGGNFLKWSQPAETALACFVIFWLGNGRYGFRN